MEFPEEIWMEVIVQVHYTDLPCIARSSKVLNKLCSDERHFKQRIEREYDNFVRLSQKNPENPYRSLYQKLK